MKRRFLSALICVVLFAGLSAAFTEASDVVAKVNGEEILQADVDQIMAVFVMPQFQAQNPGKELEPDQKAQIEKNVIEQLATETLLLQKAAEADIAADDTILTERFDQVKAQRPDLEEGLLKALIEKDYVIQTLLEQEVVSKVTVSDEEAQAYYEAQKDQFHEDEQIQASHILIQVAQDATEEEKQAAMKKIEEVLAQAKEGKDFAELAKEYSEGPSKDSGGDLGFFPKGAMVQPFEEAAFALNEGEISGVVETQFGYHIIKLTGKKAARDVSFEEVKDQLKQGLQQQKTSAEIKTWVETLKSQANIELM